MRLFSLVLDSSLLIEQTHFFYTYDFEDLVLIFLTWDCPPPLTQFLLQNILFHWQDFSIQDYILLFILLLHLFVL